jgi:hypothetical protein
MDLERNFPSNLGESWACLAIKKYHASDADLEASSLSLEAKLVQLQRSRFYSRGALFESRQDNARQGYRHRHFLHALHEN